MHEFDCGCRFETGFDGANDNITAKFCHAHGNDPVLHMVVALYDGLLRDSGSTNVGTTATVADDDGNESKLVNGRPQTSWLGGNL